MTSPIFLLFMGFDQSLSIATEASAAVLYTLALALVWYREFTIGDLPASLIESAHHLCGADDDRCLHRDEPGHGLWRHSLCHFLCPPWDLGQTAGDPDTRRPPPLAAPVVDATGAGDAFNAGWLAAILQGAGEEDTQRAGHARAALVLQVQGALLPSRPIAAPDQSW